MEDEKGHHAPPDVLVDVAEGTVVEARWQEHVAQCDSCSAEVENLKKTLESAGKMEVPEPGDAYWQDFGSRLNGRIQREGKSRKRVNRWLWAAAAAIVVVGLWVSRDGHRSVSPTSDLAETVLPPANEDPEYQFLLAIAELADGEEDWEVRFDFGPIQELDPTQLTAEEKEQLREKLEIDMEGENHAIS